MAHKSNTRKGAPSGGTQRNEITWHNPLFTRDERRDLRLAFDKNPSDAWRLATLYGEQLSSISIKPDPSGGFRCTVIYTGSGGTATRALGISTISPDPGLSLFAVLQTLHHMVTAGTVDSYTQHDTGDDW